MSSSSRKHHSKFAPYASKFEIWRSNQGNVDFVPYLAANQEAAALATDEALGRFSDALMMSEFFLAKEATIEEKQLAITALVSAVAEFAGNFRANGRRFQAPQLLSSALACLYDRKIIPDIFQITDRSPAHQKPAPFADQVRLAALGCVQKLNASGYSVAEASEYVAKKFNQANGLFSKYKSSAGRRGEEFSGKLISRWWYDLQSQKGRSSIEARLSAAMAEECAQKPPSKQEAESFVRDVINRLTTAQNFASR